MSSYIETPSFMATSHLWRKNHINYSEFKRVIKDNSHKDKNSHTKCLLYSAGSSSILNTHFYHGRKLTSREVDDKVKEFFPVMTWKEKIAEVGGDLMDKFSNNDSMLLENKSNAVINLNFEPVIKYPLKEAQLNLMGLEHIAPLKVGLKGTSYSNPKKRKFEDTIYPNSSKILKMTNWEEPVQGNWRRHGEEHWSPVIFNKGQHLVFDGEVINEGAMSNKKSQWKFMQ